MPLKSTRIPADAEALLKRMAGLCAKSEQCSFDISTKLYKAGLPKEKREEILRYLIDNKYIDDSRFARSFASYKIRFSAWGKRKIRLALMAKRIDPSSIETAIEAIDDNDYEEALLKVIKSKTRDFDLTDREQRAKLYRQLLARGFESNLISKLMKALNS